MKREFRNLHDDTKLRISQRLTGRNLSDTHKQAISDALKKYWATIPYRSTENNDTNNQHSNEKSMQTKNPN